MNREHNAAAAHLDLLAQAERTKIGRTFHVPAPKRLTATQRGVRFDVAVVAILLTAAICATLSILYPL